MYNSVPHDLKIQLGNVIDLKTLYKMYKMSIHLQRSVQIQPKTGQHLPNANNISQIVANTCQNLATNALCSGFCAVPKWEEDRKVRVLPSWSVRPLVDLFASELIDMRFSLKHPLLHRFLRRLLRYRFWMMHCFDTFMQTHIQLHPIQCLSSMFGV